MKQGPKSKATNALAGMDADIEKHTHGGRTRIDALGDQHQERLGALTGRVLDAGVDPELQAIVEELAEKLVVPVAVVTLVLERTQFFRAQTGLPADLAQSQATDRDLSFCQFVVKDGNRFEVPDALVNEQVPQGLVESHGIRAYIGEPICIGETIVGSLCGIDTEARAFDEAHRNTLASLAKRASHRLGELAAKSRSASGALLSRATAPAFAELRNVLTPFDVSLQLARVALSDLEPLTRLARASSDDSADTLSNASAAFSDLTEMIDDLHGLSVRIRDTTLALDGLVRGGPASSTASAVIELASNLAQHELKLIGGISWAPANPFLGIALPRLVVSSVVATALTLMAQASKGKLEGEVESTEDSVVFEIRGSDLEVAATRLIADELRILLDGNILFAIDARPTGLRISVPLFPPQPPISPPTR